MSKTTLRIEPDLLSKFQRKVESAAGKLKGAQNEALNEAVLLWIGYRGEEKVVSVATKRGSRVMRMEGAKDVIEDLVRDGWDEGRGASVKALFAPIENSEIVEILSPFKGFRCIEVKFTADGSGEETKLHGVEEIPETHRIDGTFLIRYDAGGGREFQVWASRYGIDVQCGREFVPFIRDTRTRSLTSRHR
jgi:hypothetical protein